MNFFVRFILARQLALNAGVDTKQATSDGLIGGLLGSPMGLVLSALLARGQAAAATPVLTHTPGPAAGLKRVAAPTQTDRA
jgi:hypothetical protein